VRYRFGVFELSPSHRVLRRDGQPVRLISRYFDLLLLLVRERHRVVTRQEIFDRVWADVVVSDGALTQAIRTIRRTLGDGPQAPQYIRTISRHGYQFVTDVQELTDDGPLDSQDPSPAPQLEPPPAGDAWSRPLSVLLREPPYASATEEERYDAAVALHELGTDEALRRLDERPGYQEARAILRDARWDAPSAGRVPLFGAHARLDVVIDVIALRIRRTARLASTRWLSAIAGGALAGGLAGIIGAVALGVAAVTGAIEANPAARPEAGIAIALTIIGIIAGALGASGIGGGLAAAEVLARSARPVALAAGAALGGVTAGSIANAGTRAVLRDIFGHDIPHLGGALEGLVLGAVIGGGYAIATRQLAQGGMAAPRGRARTNAAILTGIVAAFAGAGLALAGRALVGVSLDLVADVFTGSAVGLDPLARLLGEESLRPVTRTLVSAFEAFMLGSGITFGLTHRPALREPEGRRVTGVDARL
jgi:DNA-binding winged helix-turn-helix (wHTH) protein